MREVKQAVAVVRWWAEANSVIGPLVPLGVLVFALFGITTSNDVVTGRLWAIAAALSVGVLTLFAVDQMAVRAGIWPPGRRPIRMERAPHLTWSNVQAISVGRAFEVRVSCDGSTSLAVPMFPESWVESTVDVLEPEVDADHNLKARVFPKKEAIEYQDFAAPIEPGRFTLRMLCKESDPIPGEREVVWRVLYMDDNMSEGFITECSARVAFVLGRPTVLSSALDRTSREERNADYHDYLRSKRGSSSTGARRPHPTQDA